MKRRNYAVSALTILIFGCGIPQLSGSDKCTLEAVGNDTGSDILKATISVPREYMVGAEIPEGGVDLYWKDCDFRLNAFFAHETAKTIIEDAPTKTLTDTKRGERLVDAELGIWRFKDGSGEPRFFVTGVLKMSPISSPRNDFERQHYSVPSATN